MDANRKAAIIIGALFIAGTVLGGASAALTESIRNASDVLSEVYTQQTSMTLAAVFWLMMGLSLALIPLAAYPILKRDHPALAVGYAVFRGGLETAVYLVTAVGWLMLLPMREAFQSGAMNSAAWQSFGTAVFHARELGSAGTIVFCLGALMFYAALFQSRWIPRWLSGWGLLAALPYLAGGVLGLVRLVDPAAPVVTAMDMPLAIQEMVLALWLIVKGFNPSTKSNKEPA